jgi:hydrogenase expression/formation protein HypE
MANTAPGNVRVMRDPTRGGLATTLVEFARAGKVSIEIEEEKIPVRDEVRALCELTGFDPLYLANEGKVVIVCAEESAGTVLAALAGHFTGQQAAVIGSVTEDPLQRVYLKTRARGTRIVDMLAHEMLPRIC